jgi:hypothetical protein
MTCIFELFIKRHTENTVFFTCDIMLGITSISALFQQDDPGPGVLDQLPGINIKV